MKNYEKIERNIELFNKGFFDYIDLDIEKAKLKEIGEKSMERLRGSAEKFEITEIETKTKDELIELIMEKYKENFTINKPLNYCITKFNNFIQNYDKTLNITVSDDSFSEFLLDQMKRRRQERFVEIAGKMNMPNNDSVDDDARKQFIKESCIKALELFLKYKDDDGNTLYNILYPIFCLSQTALDEYFEKYNEIKKFTEPKIDDSPGAEPGPATVPQYDEQHIPVNDVIKIEIEKFKKVYNELLSENEKDKNRITEHERLKIEYEEFIERLGDDFTFDLESRSLKVKNPEDLSRETREAGEILVRNLDEKSKQINEIKTTKLPELFMKLVEELSREITQIEHTIGEKGKLMNDDRQLQKHIISNLTELEKSKLEAAREDGKRYLLKQFMDKKKEVTLNELGGILVRLNDNLIQKQDILTDSNKAYDDYLNGEMDKYLGGTGLLNNDEIEDFLKSYENLDQKLKAVFIRLAELCKEKEIITTAQREHDMSLKPTWQDKSRFAELSGHAILNDRIDAIIEKRNKVYQEYGIKGPEEFSNYSEDNFIVLQLNIKMKTLLESFLELFKSYEDEFNSLFEDLDDINNFSDLYFEKCLKNINVYINRDRYFKLSDYLIAIAQHDGGRKRKVSKRRKIVSRTRKKVSRTRKKVSRTRKKVSRTRKKVSRTRKKVSRTRKKVSRTRKKVKRTKRKVKSKKISTK